MTALTGDGANLSKGFLVEFKSGHVGMVQRRIGSSSSHTVTERGRPRWRDKGRESGKAGDDGKSVGNCDAQHRLALCGTGGNGIPV